MADVLAARIRNTPPPYRFKYAVAFNEEWIVPTREPSSGVKAAEILFECGASYCLGCKTFHFAELAGDRIEACRFCKDRP